jgi:hypothetical protein
MPPEERQLLSSADRDVTENRFIHNCQIHKNIRKPPFRPLYFRPCNRQHSFIRFSNTSGRYLTGGSFFLK